MHALTVLLGILAFSQGYPQSAASGNKREQLGPRIAGGSVTTIQKYPYVVSVRESMEGVADVHICGGSIISHDWVLTTGQCMMADIPDMYFVRAGNTHVDKGTRHDVSKIVTYKNFVSGDISVYDISVVKVKTQLVYSSSVQPIKLVAEGVSWSAGTKATVAGWGPTLPEGNTVDELRVAEVSVVSNSECTSAYKKNYHQEYMMCVSHKNVRVGACVNDEGSPLVHEGVQIGVSSFTTACFNGTANQGPALYTSVSYFRNWIKSETGV